MVIYLFIFNLILLEALAIAMLCHAILFYSIGSIRRPGNLDLCFC